MKPNGLQILGVSRIISEKELEEMNDWKQKEQSWDEELLINKTVKWRVAPMATRLAVGYKDDFSIITCYFKRRIEAGVI